MPVWVRILRSEGQADPKTLNIRRKCCLKVKLPLCHLQKTCFLVILFLKQRSTFTHLLFNIDRVNFYGFESYNNAANFQGMRKPFH